MSLATRLRVAGPVLTGLFLAARCDSDTLLAGATATAAAGAYTGGAYLSLPISQA